MEIYSELLQEHMNITINLPKVPLKQQPNILKCCGPIELNEKEGNYACIKCGLVKDMYYIVNEEEPCKYNHGEPVGMHTSYSYNKYREYKPLTHFREHLRRYAGQRFAVFPAELIKDVKDYVDPLSPDAFHQVKHQLKQLGQKKYNVKVYDKQMRRWDMKQYKPQKFYKDIFSLIYELGGIQPNLHTIDLNAMFSMYKAICYQFRQMKIKNSVSRKNMPSHYMLLDLMLRQYGHTPYYNIPELKDKDLRNSVLTIFNKLECNVQKIMG